MDDFKVHAGIDLRYFSDNWGPFNFDFTNLLPSGATISDCDVTAYLGAVTAKSDSSAFDDVTAEIIDSDHVPAVVDDTYVNVWFKYPSDLTLKGERATLVFEITTDSGAQHPFYFRSVNIV